MIIRTIICDKCGNEFKENMENGGFPGWGHIAGIMNDETGSDKAYLCPDCLKKLMKWLNNVD